MAAQREKATLADETFPTHPVFSLALRKHLPGGKN